MITPLMLFVAFLLTGRQIRHARRYLRRVLRRLLLCLHYVVRALAYVLEVVIFLYVFRLYLLVLAKQGYLREHEAVQDFILNNLKGY